MPGREEGVDEKCKFCGSSLLKALDDTPYFDCWMRRDYNCARPYKCLKTELAALKSLVREMGKVIDNLSRGRCCCEQTIIPCRHCLSQRFMDLPEVRAIMEEKP